MYDNPSPLRINASNVWNITKLGCNYHLYVVWYLLKVAELDGQRDGNTVWLPWIPVVLSERQEGYRTIARALSVLIRLNVLKEVVVNYMTRKGKEDILMAYKSKTLNYRYFEWDEDGREEERLFNLDVSFWNPELDCIQFSILLDEEAAKSFVVESSRCWSTGETVHPEFCFATVAKQKEVILKGLKEKFSIYEYLEFTFDRSDIPNWVDSFAVLLALEEEGLIHLLPQRKRIENESGIPKTFQIALKKDPEAIRMAVELEEASFSYDCTKDIFCFKDEVIRLKDRNMVFVKEFFDLCRDVRVGVDISELLEGIESATLNMRDSKKKNATKAYIYDQRVRLNGKIEEQTKISDFFIIRNNRVYLSNPHCIKVT